MAKILVYNSGTGRVETYYRGENEAMPYNVGRTLTVKEFRGSSDSSLLWTDKRFIETWNSFRSYYGSTIPVGFAFKRIWEGGHGNQSQHYAGGAFDVGQKLTQAQRNNIWKKAKSFGGWSYVEPIEMTPTWVHFDKRLGPPACASGFPMVRRGSKGVYVMILQDALNALGYRTNGLDGIFGSGTDRAVKSFQKDNYLTADGIVGCATWTALTSKAKGIGRTSTVVDP